ncbi:MAG: hypothetical protein CYPHOPRED_005231 [Cyphobasidiales sp. Tagirdzhanova-0007]|nr:MAG: hypothetical protein CYPHOPRED_005231 [Cyphobasidiales sp. Tagirdzhanova-0007]
MSPTAYRERAFHRLSVLADHLVQPNLQPARSNSTVSAKSKVARDMSNFQQEAHKLLVIPGPIEVADDVLFANAHPSMSHMSPDFSKVFQDCITKLKQVLYTEQGQPFIVAGSGTLGWDMAASNLVEPGEDVLVLNSGYFGDAFADCLSIYGAKVEQLVAPVGDKPNLTQIEEALKKRKYKMLTFTHVDTSTGVLSDAKEICELTKRISPDTITVLDGVCSVGSEEIRMDAWGVDVVLAASQKGLGVPPGLCVVCASPKAISAFKARKAAPTSYFASWAKWLPVMEAYGKGSAAYFATPPVQIIYALQASLTSMTEKSPTLEERFALHKEASNKLKTAIQDMGLVLVTLSNGAAANGMTAVYTPDNLTPGDIVPKMLKRGVIIAAGLHKDIKAKYFRIGHMGITVVDKSRGDIDNLITALKESFIEAGFKPKNS